MPGFGPGAPSGVPAVGKGLPVVRQFAEVVPIFEERNYTITGVTQDLTGAPLGTCTVYLFNAATNVLAQITTSDASGNYSFVVDKTQFYYERCQSVADPNIVGTTISTLSGA